MCFQRYSHSEVSCGSTATDEGWDISRFRWRRRLLWFRGRRGWSGRVKVSDNGLHYSLDPCCTVFIASNPRLKYKVSSKLMSFVMYFEIIANSIWRLFSPESFKIAIFFNLFISNFSLSQSCMYISRTSKTVRLWRKRNLH